jgi:hypothetical protein
LKARD